LVASFAVTVGRPIASANEKPAQLANDPKVANARTVGANAMPAALKRIHQEKASLQTTS
jgi:hypothetical protein